MNLRAIAVSIIFGVLLAACSEDGVSNGGRISARIEGVSQKGPVLMGSSVVVQELDSATLLQTGNSFRGKVVNDRGEFSIDNVDLNSPYVLLEVNGYFRNEVTGQNSNGQIFMKALADIEDRSQVNVNLLTHLEYERVQVLLEKKKMSVAEAKREADREIFAAFYDEGDFGSVENLNIFGDGDGDAALLAINILLLGRMGEADFMERFAKLGEDLAEDGVWDDSLLKAEIADDACVMDLAGKLPNVRENMEEWQIKDNIVAFEPYVTTFWENVYGLGKCDASNQGETKKNFYALSELYGKEFTCDKSGRWTADVKASIAGCDLCGVMVDSRDGREYRTVRMAGLNWMAENLAYKGSPYEMQKYAGVSGFLYGGKKYTGNFVGDNICPDGWRLPSKSDFAELLESGLNDEYSALLSKKGWNLNLGDENDAVAYWNSTGVGESMSRTLYTFSGSKYSLKVDSVVLYYYQEDAWAMVRCVEDNGEGNPYDYEKCSAAEEGIVNLTEGGWYYKCEQGLWRFKDAMSTCDTAGAAVGDTCIRFRTLKSMRLPVTFVYEGGGNWVQVDKLENYYCPQEGASVGDTCSFSVTGGAKVLCVYEEERWEEIRYDEKFGYCMVNTRSDWYRELDGVYYRCEYGDWVPVTLVPHQYTDPRKEGLTDEEYDVLDLPKDASVGDRIGGLLEDCYNDEEMPLDGTGGEYYEVYDYCMPKKYYRYREDGSWTLETENDLKNNSAYACVAGTEGVEYIMLPRPREPGIIFKRTSVECDPVVEPNSIIEEECYCSDALVEYVFGRYEKK